MSEEIKKKVNLLALLLSFEKYWSPYTLSDGALYEKETKEEAVKMCELFKEIYGDIEIQTNEEKEIELGFKTKKNARNFVKVTSRLSVIYREDRTRYSMQLIADILKKLSDENKISKKNLYELKESEVIDIIESSKYNDIFNIWKNAKKVKISKEKPKNIYYVHHGAKIRYIDPLFNGKRISKCCKLANKMIKNNLSYNMDNYVYLNFNF